MGDELLTRFDDWQTRLTTFLSRQRGERTDCALFVADAVREMTGFDHAAGLRGKYRSHRGGIRVLRKQGFRDHVEFVESILPEIAPALAQPGDVVVVPVEGEKLLALGIMQGAAGCYVLNAQGGIGIVPLSQVTRAFGV